MTEKSRGKTKNKSPDLARGELMPTISSNAGDEYQAYATQVSPIVRTLALTAIAVIWLFGGGKNGSPSSALLELQGIKSSTPLVAALGLALAVLVADLLQYVWAAFAWGAYRWALEQVLVNDEWNPDDLHIRARAGWFVARMFYIPRYLEYRLGVHAQERRAHSWSERRDHLREVLRRSVDSTRNSAVLGSALNVPWSPLVINRIVAVLFVLKISLLISCYAVLGTLLLT